MCFKYFSLTFNVFVVSCDVLESGEANSFGANKGSNSLRVFAEADHPTLAYDDRVDSSVHLSIDKGHVIEQVNTPVFDCFYWSWATAEDS